LAAVAVGVTAGIAILYGAGALYGMLTVSSPLDRVFGESPSVVSHTIVARQPVMVVRVTLDEVDDLREEVRTLEERASSALRGQPVQIQVRDNRDAALAAAYHSMHFYIQEAVVTGRFSEMNERIASCARQAGLDKYKVFVDDDRVYVQLHLDGRHLYEIVSREERPEAPRSGA
jgi:hypothetical protein